jgi:hypothetical protein
MKPVAWNEWSASDLINPTDSARNEQATGKQGAGGLASLNCRELNPDCPASHDTSNNTEHCVSTNSRASSKVASCNGTNVGEEAGSGPASSDFGGTRTHHSPRNLCR